ncbi:MAG TPA: hypothetical protein VF209_02575 [Patescibacteria group bacterium]
MRATQVEFHSFDAQGRYFPERFSPQFDQDNLPNVREQVWTSEIDAQVKSIWETISQQFHTRFDISILSYQPDLFIIVPLPTEADLSTRFINYTHQLSGHIVLQEHVLNEPQLLIDTLSHEMGHFYAHRRILESKRKGTFSSKWQSIQTGLRSSWLGRYPLQNTEPKNFRPLVFTLFDEALNELTTTQLYKISQHQSFDLDTQESRDQAYKDDVRLFKLLIKGLLTDAHLPHHTKEYVFQLFQEIAWGKNWAASRNEIMQLANAAYSPDIWQAIVRITWQVPADSLSDPSNKSAKILWDMVTRPLPKGEVPPWPGALQENSTQLTKEPLNKEISVEDI